MSLWCLSEWSQRSIWHSPVGAFTLSWSGGKEGGPEGLGVSIGSYLKRGEEAGAARHTHTVGAGLVVVG